MPAPETSPFDQQFAAALELARWNEIADGQSGWFAAARLAEGRYQTQTVQLTEVRSDDGNVYHPAPGVDIPAWMARSALRLDYRHRAIGPNGESSEGMILNNYSYNSDEMGRWRQPAVRNARLLSATVGRVCVRWCRLVDTFDDLGVAVGTYVDYMGPDKRETASGDNYRLATTSLQRSLMIAMAKEAPYTDAEPYMSVLDRLNPDNNNHQKLREIAALILADIVLGQKMTPNTFGLTNFPKIGTDLSLAAADALSERGFLLPEWWFGTGIANAGTVHVPALLPKLYEMLAGGNGETLLANFPAENSQALIKSYITELINRYAQDDTRDRAVMRRLQQTVIDGRGVADLAQLITVANGIIKGQNEMREPEEEPQPLLDRQSMFSVGDALLIVLEQTRPLSATDDEWSALFEQDVQHAEIIDTLHVLTRKDRSEAMRLTSVFLRYPLASDQTIVDIRGQLTTGAAPATVRVQRGSRDKADRTVSIWRLKYRRSGGLLT